MRNNLVILSRTCACAFAGVVFLPALIAVVPQSAAAPRRFVLVENMRINSDESSPDRMLSSITDVLTLRDGSVVIALNQERSLRVYSRSGVFERAISLRGQGPGEISYLSGMGSFGDTIWVIDRPSNKAVLLDKNGNRFRTVTLPRSGLPGAETRLALLPGDRAFASVPYRQSRGPEGLTSPSAARDSAQYFLIRTDGTRERLLFAQPPDVAPMIPIDYSGMKAYIEQMLVPQLLWHVAASTGELVITADPALWGGKPGTLRVIRLKAHESTETRTDVAFQARRPTAREIDSIKTLRGGRAPTTQEERVRREALLAGLRDHLYVPAYMPVASKLVVGTDGLLWFRHAADPGVWSVVDGTVIKMQVTATRQVEIMRASGNEVWGMLHNSDGVPSLARFVLTPAN